MADLKDRIRDLREREGWSQKELADRLEVAPTTLANWEQGRRKPELSRFIAMLDIFGVSADYLLGLVDTPHGTVKPGSELEPGWEDALRRAKRSGLTVKQLDRLIRYGAELLKGSGEPE